MQSYDQWGLTITTPDEQAATRYRELVEAYLTMSPETASCMAAATTGEVAPMSRIAVGYLMLLANTPFGQEAAVEAHRRVADHEGDLDEREALHLRALGASTQGATKAACEVWRTILNRWPMDVLALRLDHFERFSNHDLSGMAESVDHARREWDEDAPYRSYLEGMAGFAAEERGDYALAEELARTAVEQDPSDLWSIHAVAHVLEMQSRVDEGIEWISTRASTLEAGGSFAGHLWWHLALHHLALGDHSSVLDLVDRRITAEDSIEGLMLTNTVSLLARLDFLGVDVGDRWSSVAGACGARIGHHTRPFNDCHYAYALARAGDESRSAAVVEGMRAWSQRDDDAAETIRAVGLDTAIGMAALAADDSPSAVDRLMSTSGRWHLLGGSNAQRDVFTRALKYAESR